MVMAEYEWIEARLSPATVYHARYPKAPIAVLAEPGEGHFAGCDDLVRYLAMFIRKCVEQRLPALDQTPLDKPPVLNPIDPAQGWLVQRWTLNQKRTIAPRLLPNMPAIRSTRSGRSTRKWRWRRTTIMRIKSVKRPQLIDFVQDGELVPVVPQHAMVNLKWLPMEDGETFKFEAKFLDSVTSMGAENDVARRNNHIRWSGLPAGAALGHSSNGRVEIHRIEGPIEEIAPNTFRLSFYRGWTPRQQIWLAATHPATTISNPQSSRPPCRFAEMQRRRADDHVRSDPRPESRHRIAQALRRQQRGLAGPFLRPRRPRRSQRRDAQVSTAPAASEVADQGDDRRVAVGESRRESREDGADGRADVTITN
jgi:hypothetical protein